MARKLFLMRHAKVAGEYAGRYLGRTDVPIVADDDARIREVARWLKGQHIGQCMCSPRLRARQTAQIVSESLNCPIMIDEDLREIDFGRWEARSFDEISRMDPEHVQNWAQLRDDFTFPDGEMWGAFLARVKRAAGRLAADPADAVLTITHGGVIRSIICQLLGLDARNYLLFDVKCSGCCVIDLFDGKGILSGMNLPATGEEN